MADDGRAGSGRRGCRRFVPREGEHAAFLAAEAAQFVELASHLIEVVDPSTRSLVAARLAAYPAAPAVLLQRLVDFGALPHLPELSRPAAPRTTTSAQTAPAVTAPAVQAQTQAQAIALDNGRALTDEEARAFDARLRAAGTDPDRA